MGVFELGSTIVKRTPFGGLNQQETHQTKKLGGTPLVGLKMKLRPAIFGVPSC